MSRDPIGEWYLGDLAAWNGWWSIFESDGHFYFSVNIDNLYDFVSNSPGNSIDLWGLAELAPTAGKPGGKQIIPGKKAKNIAKGAGAMVLTACEAQAAMTYKNCLAAAETALATALAAAPFAPNVNAAIAAANRVYDLSAAICATEYVVDGLSCLVPFGCIFGR